LPCCFCWPLLFALRWFPKRGRRARRATGSRIALLGGPNPAPVVYQSDKQTQEAENQLELRLDVQRLYALSTELKDEVDRSDRNAPVSVSLLKRTQDIEKLAKQIRERAKR